MSLFYYILVVSWLSITGKLLLRMLKTIGLGVFVVIVTSIVLIVTITIASKPVYQPTAVSTDVLFSPDHSWTATLSAEKITTIISTGDVLLARAVNAQNVSENNCHRAFEHVADVLKSADMTVINLETPLIDECPVTYQGMEFCGDIRNADGLLYAGIDAVNIANNHMGNWGQRGVETTVFVLQDVDIVPFGHENPMYVDKGNRGDRGHLNIALLGYNDVGRQIGIAHVDDGTFEHDIRLAASTADIVIASFHWGNEYTYQPTVRQIAIAHKAIDAGADIVLGNHPHWIQPIELYRDKLIVYSHGNFIFDQTWSKKTQEGIIVKYTFYDDILVDAEVIPIVSHGYGETSVAIGVEKDQLLNQFIISD